MAKHNSELFSRTERVYAVSLLELAEQAGQVRDVEAELQQLAEVAKQEPKLLTLLSNRRVPMARRQATALKIFKGRVNDLTLKFIQVLVERDRFDELPGIAAAFLAQVHERYGEIEVDAIVATPMSEELAARLGEALHKRTGRKPIIHQHLEPNQIGGVKLRVADYLVDGSVSTQLRLMREKIIEDSRAFARRDADRIFKD